MSVHGTDRDRIDMDRRLPNVENTNGLYRVESRANSVYGIIVRVIGIEHAIRRQ